MILVAKQFEVISKQMSSIATNLTAMAEQQKETHFVDQLISSGKASEMVKRRLLAFWNISYPQMSSDLLYFLSVVACGLETL